MPYATNEDLRLYYELEGPPEAPPLLLHHGLTRTLESWRVHGFTAALAERFRLILVDGRGHGRSDAPHEAAAYTAERRASDIVAVLDAVGAEQAHVWGYSMGGHVAYAVARYAPERLRSLIVGGQHPYPRDRQYDDRRLEVIRRGMLAFVEDSERLSGPLAEPERSAVLAQDLDAMVAVCEAYRDASGLDEGLAELTVPTLIYCGDRDRHFEGARRAAATIPGARFVPLEGVTHPEGGQRSDLVVPHVLEFLAAVDSDGDADLEATDAGGR